MFNYYFDYDRDGNLSTIAMFEAIGRGEYEGYTSEYVVFELKKAQEPKRSDMLNLIDKYAIKILDLDEKIDILADLYIDSNILPEKFRLDALHIACAAVKNLDIVLSFNYQHINKLKTKIMTESINKLAGYKGIIICTPMELLD
jgi:predicted nucleic acid-binding protein